MNIILQSDNTLHHAYKPQTGDPRVWITGCFKTVAMIGQKCPQKESHKIIYPNCILHTPPKKCSVCFA